MCSAERTEISPRRAFFVAYCAVCCSGSAGRRKLAISFDTPSGPPDRLQKPAKLAMFTKKTIR
jgi:hypothetical protein